MIFPVFDLHCDTAFALLHENMRTHKLLRRNDLHFDLERAGELPGYAQCFACFSSPMQKHPPVLMFEREMETITAEIESNRDLIHMAYNAAHIKENKDNGRMSAILTIEGPAGFGFDPALLEDLYKIGFRISTLGWNEDNVLTGSHITGGGLTDLGRCYVKEAQRLGMIIDVSHISDRGFWDIIEMADAPVIASHSNSRAICGVSRNLTDDMFRAICQTGGVAGINLYAGFLGESPDLNTVADHIIHFLELDPSGKHIALGSDMDGCDALPAGFAGVQDYPKLADRLLDRGLDTETVYDIFWNNAIGVMERCCM